MEAFELNEILEQHRLWLNGKGGKCANLKDADLNGAILYSANLYGAKLNGAKLNGANLEFASLYRANLTGANLTDANLTDANLTDANLTGVILRDISWIIPGCLVQLNQIKYNFPLYKEVKYDNFVQDSFGVFIQDNREEKTFDMLAGDRIIRNIPDWVKYSGLKQVLS